MKKVILLLIDALMPEALENAVKSGKTPALAFLMKNGVYHSDCVTSFPTMTASVDSSLMTGVYPDKHKVPGLIWYDAKENRLINYINGTKTVLKLGFMNTAKDVLYNLNERHLNKETKTIYEDLADHGKTSGSVNFIIHRGRQKHQIKPPFLLNLFTRFQFNNKQVSGPDLLSIGSLHKPQFTTRKIPWSFNQTFLQRFGINDDFAIHVTKEAIESGQQPDFMVVYLPEHDHYLHKHIDQPLKSLEKVDKKIADLLQTFGSFEEAIKQNVFIIIGDHGQTKISSNEDANIDLDQLLKPFRVTPLGKKVSEPDEVIFANNERMVYVYPLQQQVNEGVRNTLETDERIDFIAWKEKNKVIVSNHAGKKLSYYKKGNFVDAYGESWNIEGDLELLDLSIEEKTLKYNLYPDVLSRLYGALFAQDISLFVIVAKPGYEFISRTFPTHKGGGSHGSLHRIDSIVPLLVTGASKDPQSNIRIVDLKNYILQLLNVKSTTTG